MDDEDAFLYGAGGTSAAAPLAANADIKAVLNGNSEPSAAPTAGDEAGGEDGEVAMDEDESESDIEITLEADPNAPPSQYLSQRPQYPAYLRAPATGTTAANQPRTYDMATKPAVDVPLLRQTPDIQPGATPAPMSLTDSGMPRPEIEKPAIVDDGDSLLDVDIDDLPDQPWRKAGAVVSEFFNYGFDEATWKAYCARQRISRDDRDKERDAPYAVFATLPVQEAWDSLSMENRTALMHTIASSFASSLPNGVEAFSVKSEGGDDAGPMSPRPVVSGPPAPPLPTGPAATRRPAPDRPPVPVRPVSPLPDNIPTGPRGSRPPAAVQAPPPAPPPQRQPSPVVTAPVPAKPRNHLDYRDSDMDGSAGKDDAMLDYGNERAERDDLSPASNRGDRKERSSRDRRRGSRDRERDGIESGEERDEKATSRRSRRENEWDKDKERSERRTRGEKDDSASSKRSRRDEDREDRASTTRSRATRTKVEDAFATEESEEEHRSSKRSRR